MSVRRFCTPLVRTIVHVKGEPEVWRIAHCQGYTLRNAENTTVLGEHLPFGSTYLCDPAGNIIMCNHPSWCAVVGKEQGIDLTPATPHVAGLSAIHSVLPSIIEYYNPN